MMMDRFFGSSVSAAIRVAGAKKNGEHIEEDTIGKALAAELGRRSFVGVGQVLDTVPGELANTNGVERIFHVATAQGLVRKGLATDVQCIKMCAQNVLEAVEAKRAGYNAILLPMLGTGLGGLTASEVAPVLVNTAVSFLKSGKAAGLKEICILAYSFGDEAALIEAMKTCADLAFDREEIAPAGPVNTRNRVRKLLGSLGLTSK